LKLKYDGALSNSAFSFNLRRYSSAPAPITSARRTAPGEAVLVYPIKFMFEAPGAKRLTLNMINRLRSLLSISTGGGTPWAVLAWLSILAHRNKVGQCFDLFGGELRGC